MTIPDDFPRDPCPTALSGVQPTVAALLINGKYVVGLTPEERAVRYDTPGAVPGLLWGEVL